MKKYWSLVLGIGLVVGCLALPGAALAQRDTLMLVVPARYSVLQFSFDVARLYPAVLVSYQGDAKTVNPTLHAWNGQEWVPITVADYQSAAFLSERPTRCVLVGDDTLLPPTLKSAQAWCPQLLQVAQLDNASLANQLGAFIPFTKSDWAWLAGRYNLTLKDRNASQRQKSWYDYQWVDPDPPAWLEQRPKHAKPPRKSNTMTETPAPPAPTYTAGSEPVDREVSLPPAAVQYESTEPVTPAPSVPVPDAPANWSEKAVADEIK